MEWLLRTAVILMLITPLYGAGCSGSFASPRYSNIQSSDERLQMCFVKDGFIYYVHRKLEDRGSGVDFPLFIYCKMTLRFYKSTLSEIHYSDNNTSLLKFDDDFVAPNTQNFLRWRLTARQIWGTERILDDQLAKIFHIPLKEIVDLKKGQSKLLSDSKLSDDDSLHFLEKYYGPYGDFRGLVRWYWEKKGIGISASGLLTNGKWPIGIKGIYFDFIPTNNDKAVLEFVLHDNDHLSAFFAKKEGILKDDVWSQWERPRNRRNLIKVWLRKQDNSSPESHIEEIDTDMNEPFCVFEKNSDYHFTTLSGKIYVAPKFAVDPKKVERLIAELDSDDFATRERATRDLRSLGKPIQNALENSLSKSISTEQKRRINRILDELKPLPDRETKLLWNDAKRPVDKLLFDLDNKKTYAFTKPNKDKQIYFFEIADKPQPRLFTGNTNPDAPAAVPASTRLFLEYARFVRKLK